jgi:hypothetical protein
MLLMGAAFVVNLYYIKDTLHRAGYICAEHVLLFTTHTPAHTPFRSCQLWYL